MAVDLNSKINIDVFRIVLRIPPADTPSISVQTPSIDMNGYNRKSPSKRRYEGSKYSSAPKKKARASKERIPQPKNTVAMLNELRHGLVYKLESQTGPVHAPLFTISVEEHFDHGNCVLLQVSYVFMLHYGCDNIVEIISDLFEVE
uniref:Uncharacterized protein n=1 Tax=Glossina austeni TaxID=7395 RepID=A0A1A9UVM1_GLOAU